MTDYEPRIPDLFPSNRKRDNRRIYRFGKNSRDRVIERDSEIERGTEEPLVQSLSVMASHLIDSPDTPVEDSVEKDIYLQGLRINDGSSIDSQFDENSSGENEDVMGPTFFHETSGESLNEAANAELKTLVGVGNILRPKPPSWFPEHSNSLFSTTPKGLTTWSAVNGENLMSSENEELGLGELQKFPSSHVSSFLTFERPSTPKPLSTTTSIQESSKITSTVQPASTTRRFPTPIRRNPLPYTRFKPKRPNPSKYVKPRPVNVIAKPISSDKNQTTFKVVVSEKYGHYNRATKRPFSWPRNPTTKRPKKTAFTRITTKKPYIHQIIKATKNPVLTLTTPSTTTINPPSTTVYLRNPYPTPLISAFPITFTSIPFLDFVRSQIFPRIGLSVLSFMASSPILLTLLGTSLGRRRRDLGLNFIDKGTSEFKFRNIIKKLDTNLQEGKQMTNYENYPASIFNAKFTSLLASLLNHYFKIPLKDNTKKPGSKNRI